MEVVLTQHAYDRLRERLGLSKKAAERIAIKAYENGIRHGETNGRLFKYILSMTYAYKNKGACNILYGENVYCFVNEGEIARLITVFGIPKNLLDISLKKQKKKKGEKS